MADMETKPFTIKGASAIWDSTKQKCHPGEEAQLTEELAKRLFAQGKLDMELDFSAAKSKPPTKSKKTETAPRPDRTSSAGSDKADKAEGSSRITLKSE